MSVNIYKFPPGAELGKILSKSLIYKHAKPNSNIKDLFVKEVENIVWTYKLSPGTLNLPAGEGVEEIQVLTIALRTGTLSHKVLQTVDKAIPSPIFFILTFEGKKMYSAAYKRPSEADKNKWVISRYFETRWCVDDSVQIELPPVLNLGSLYRTILQGIIPLPVRKNESLDELVLRADKLESLEKGAAKMESRIIKEKQFNRKVELNTKLKQLKQEIEELKKWTS